MHPPPVPDGFKQVLGEFGDIFKFVKDDGTLSPEWEHLNIVRIVLPEAVPYASNPAIPITRIAVHRLIADQTSAMLAEVYKMGLWWTLGPYGGGYIYRPNRNAPTRVSLHAFGIAFDWDPDKYPNKSHRRRYPGLKTITARYGFMWGEDFIHTKDPMHMQYAINC